jgi:hypothetical protein
LLFDSVVFVQSNPYSRKDVFINCRNLTKQINEAHVCITAYSPGYGKLNHQSRRNIYLRISWSPVSGLSECLCQREEIPIQKNHVGQRGFHLLNFFLAVGYL